jgi:hypothetical protein
LSPWLKRTWCLPAGADAAFVAAMEDVLAVYARPVDPARPLVCFDESGKELQAHARPPEPLRPGCPAREDSQYIRGGSANLFLWCAPHLGQRGITVTERRTKLDWAAWTTRRNATARTVDWQFTTADARIKLRRLYPVTEHANSP